MSRRSLGLALLALISLVDVAGPLLTDGEHPPMAVAVVGSVLGLASLAFAWYAGRGARRALAPLIGLRVLSALTAVPAFFAADVPAAARALAAVFVALTAGGIALVTVPARAGVARTEVAR
jgi:hypothetical protein